MPANSAKLKFSRLRLRNRKNFSAPDVALQDRMFLVGPNASGKSNFLDAFRFLRDLASSGGGFQEAVRKRLPGSDGKNTGADPNQAHTVS